MASGVDARLLKSTKFPSEFNQKVDMQKVNLQVMKKSVTTNHTIRLGRFADFSADGSLAN
jgi:serine/arginine repetitive matrix protein 1